MADDSWEAEVLLRFLEDIALDRTAGPDSVRRSGGLDHRRAALTRAKVCL